MTQPFDPAGAATGPSQLSPLPGSSSPTDSPDAPAPRSTAVRPLHRIVTLGASAGGVEALSRVLAAMPAAPGYCIVVVTHLDATQESSLPQVLQAQSSLPVSAITHWCPIEHDRVLVLPPDAGVTALDGHLRLHRRPPGLHLPLDGFLSSVAQDAELQGAAVILSGAGNDGSAGLVDLKASGGHVLAQRPDTAAQPGMPQAAIDTGLVDAVLAPEEVPAALAAWFDSQEPNVMPEEAAASEAEADKLTQVLEAIRARAGIDLSYVKNINLRRRLMRRVLMHKGRTLTDYVSTLQADANEAAALRDDILIGVTAFFRDPDFVSALRDKVIPNLLARPDAPLRLWVPACSTGEEVYTIAMLLRAELAARRSNRPVQIFGTDVSDHAISFARRARYSAAAVEAVPPEFREEGFERDGEDYVVAKSIRSLCIFAKHSLLANAPFSGMDFVSCRNLLIYLRKDAQQHVFDVLHYALKPDGLLVLGRSESVAGSTLFHHAGAPNVYAKNPLARQANGRPPALAAVWPGPQPGRAEGRGSAAEGLDQLLSQSLAARYIPAGLLVNDLGDVLQFRGAIAPFMAPASGDATLSATRLVRAEMRVPLRTALIEAARTASPVRRERIALDDGVGELEVLPLTGPEGVRCFYVALSHAARPVPGTASSTPAGDSAHHERDLERTIEALSEELDNARTQLKSVVAEFEAANEELRTSNEEVLSANEELQSANDELQRVQRQVESANQELGSLNQELRGSNARLILLNDDLSNLIEGIPLPVLLLDRDLCLRHFSPQAEALFNLDAGSVGQPLGALEGRFAVADIEALLHTAMRDLMPVEGEIEDHHGRWHVVRARAYRTADHRIDGAVLTFQDIDDLRKSLDHARTARAEAERANTAKNDFLALVSHELRAPLNAIAGWASVLQRQPLDGSPETTARVQRSLATIVRNCKAQAQLIDDLLDVSRITSGRLALDLRQTDLAASVRVVLEGLRPVTEAKDIHLYEAGLGQPLWVHGDPRRLQQVASNIIQNAIKFTPRGGHIEVALLAVDGHVELCVTDDGIGIAPSLMPGIFERFAQVEVGKTREYGGLGLGLSIVKHLVEAHGGAVNAHSTGEGHGTRLVVRLPSVEGPVGEEPVPAPPPAPSRRLAGLRVLVVDDEAEGREALASLLSLAGARTTLAASAAEAQAALETGSFDILVSDIGMPGATGYDLVRAVRARERRDQIPRVHAVALTGYAAMQDRDEALASGFDDHAAKPVDAELLIERLGNALRRG